MVAIVVLSIWHFFCANTDQGRVACNYPEDQTWLFTRYEECKAAANERNVPLVVIFTGSDWCKTCMWLEKSVLADSQFTKFASGHLAVYRADFPRKKNALPEAEIQEVNQQLAGKLNPEGTFPRIVLLTPDEQVAGALNYARETPAEVIAWIQEAMRKIPKTP